MTSVSLVSSQRGPEASAERKVGLLGRFVLFTLGFIAYFQPAYYAVSPTVFNIWRASVIVVSLLFLALYLASCPISLRWLALVLGTIVYYIVSTGINGSDGFDNMVLFNTVKVCGFITLLEYGLTKHRDLCLRAFLLAGAIMCSVHFATFLQYRYSPLGMRSAGIVSYGELAAHPWFFFHHDNGSVFYFLPVLGGLWYYANLNRRFVVIAVVASALTLYMYWSLWTVTAMIVTTAAVILFSSLWLMECRWLRRVLSYRKAVIIGVVLCVLVIAFYSSDLLASLSNVLGKAEDLGRGRIWTRAIPIIIGSPLFGMGVESDMTTIMRIGINHCHNVLLQVLYSGGFVSLLFFSLGIAKCDKKILAGANHSMTAAGATLCVSIIALFAVGTIDWYLFMPIQFFPFIMYHFDNSANASCELKKTPTDGSGLSS